MDEQQAVTAENAEETAAEQPQGAQTDWKAEARKWERYAKENASKAKELDDLKAAQLTEQERLVKRAEEAEAKLADLIIQMKTEIAALRSGKATEYPDGVSPKKKQLAAYLIENPGVSNKSYIARQLGMAITTVHKYYDEVRAELAALAVS